MFDVITTIKHFREWCICYWMVLVVSYACSFRARGCVFFLSATWGCHVHFTWQTELVGFFLFFWTITTTKTCDSRAKKQHSREIISSSFVFVFFCLFFFFLTRHQQHHRLECNWKHNSFVFVVRLRAVIHCTLTRVI